jgi:integrase
MRGSLRQRSNGSWLLTLEFGYRYDPETGRNKRIQKYITFHGTKRQAETRLNDLIRDVQHDTFIQPDKRTVGEWLDTWVDLAIKPPQRTERAYDTYRSVIAVHLKPAFEHVRLQGLRVLDVEAFLTSKAATLAPATMEKVYTVLSSALKAAVRNSLVARNVASAVANKPHAPEGHSKAVSNCWSAEDAAAFLVVARATGPQPAAFFALALDSGMRKSELAGLRWTDIDLVQGRVVVQRQLLTGGHEPVFTVPKGKRARIIDLAPETIDLLKAHRVHQAAVKMRHRRDYHDHGLVFAKPWNELGRTLSALGDPLQINNLGEREFEPLISAAKVSPISLHGLRHTCATLLLAAGVPSRVVQERLGHKKIETTLSVYGHVLPGQQRDAARRLGSLLYRR